MVFLPMNIVVSMMPSLPTTAISAEASFIIGMAHTLRLKVLAEGVETQAQLDFLKEKGCDYYQGYYKSPVLSADHFAALIQSK